MNHAFRVGITGGIGSGKSAVTERLEARGITVVDADLVAREVVEPGEPALTAIEEHFGKALIGPDGRLDRAQLRRIVFDDPRQRMWLEKLTHPLIAARIRELLAGAQSAYAVLSSPLLLEGAQADFVQHVVVVDVPEALQLARTAARDDNSEALVRSIMAAQLDREARLARADTVIDNSGTLAELDSAVIALHKKLLGLAEAHSD